MPGKARKAGKSGTGTKPTPRYVKCAISMPAPDFAEMEAFRKRQKLSRSQMVVLLWRHWREELSRRQAIDQYVRGYELIPEEPTLFKVMESVQSSVLGEDIW